MSKRRGDALQPIGPECNGVGRYAGWVCIFLYLVVLREWRERALTITALPLMIPVLVVVLIGMTRGIEQPPDPKSGLKVPPKLNSAAAIDSLEVRSSLVVGVVRVIDTIKSS